jgi:hopanoid biosynthesis associated RND transporter like protein HpnN
VEAWLSRALVAWVAAAGRHARVVLWATAVTTLAAVVYAALQLGVNTHHSAILSDDMPFWRDYNEFAEVFPILDEALLVVVDAESSGAALEAAQALAERLAQQPEAYDDIYVPGGDEYFQRHALLYLEVEELQDLADQLAGVQPLLAEVAEDSSLQHLATVLREGIERLRTDPDAPVDLSLAFDSLSRAVSAVLRGQPQPISWTELILRRKLPGDSSRRVVVLHPIYDYTHLLPGRDSIEGVRRAARELGLVPENGVLVRITGNVALNTEEMISVGRGSLLSVGGSFVLVAVLVWLALRSARLVVAALLTLLVSLAWTAAFAALAVGYVNVLSVCFAVMMIGLGIDFAIHFGMRYAELLRAGEGHDAALQESAGSVGASLVLCASTTAVAFFVFIPTDFRAVGQLGLISGVGMLVSLFATLTVLPALLCVWRPASVRDVWGGALWFERLVITASVHHPRTVRLGALLLALLSLLALPRLRFDHNISRLRDPGTESVQTLDELLEESETSPWTMDLMEPSLDAATAVAERLRELPVVERAVTLRDYVPGGQEEKLAILGELGYFVPEPREGAAPPPDTPLATQIETLAALRDSLRAPWLAEGDPERAASAARAAGQLERFLERLAALERKSQQQEQLAAFERALTGALPGQMRQLWLATDPDPVALEDLPESLTRRMLAPDGRARVEILAREDLGDNVAHARFVDQVRRLAPEATGSAVTLLEFGRAVVSSFQQALSAAVLAISALLWLLWRRLSDMLLVLAPLALAALLTAATAGVFGIPFNFANVVVLPLLLGIGVDTGIHLVHRHRVTIETIGHAEAPERELLTTSTAQAVLFSSLTTMASFGTMALSSHVGFASLGELLLAGVSYTLLANLLVLPALLALRGGAAPPGGDAA